MEVIYNQLYKEYKMFVIYLYTPPQWICNKDVFEV